MSRDSASLIDIVRDGELILQFAQGVSREQLESDVMRQSAILYQITIMGEATKRLSREFRSQHTEVPWDDIAGMRDMIAHQYDRLDMNIVWQVIQRNIPDLLIMIVPLLPVQDD
ncbi:HepT-like ribonuclease domain-containing protein [Allocoleopsis franciscana]|uniref:DUF86 domain-containing protein n=1 Tax=Allocoleopsis franciscana PCC 7113 TaxID=1173027 RepID=K9WFZ7_9CYAN|nr:DUF86 domain-containing protein [Allocoleopsis franciscana]AFZ18716.1 hypothetical protein Mic7113_2941 [Allocoleopsis franciscana PCC 7113]